MILATTSSIAIGVVMIAAGVLNLVFRGFRARRDTAVQRAHRDTAPPALRRLYFTGSEQTNLRLVTAGGIALIVLGIVIVATGL